MPQPQVGYSAAQGSPMGWRPMGGPALGTPPQAGPSPYGALVSLRGGPATGVPHIVCFRSSTNDCPASCEFELTGSTCLWQQLYWGWSSNSNLEYFEEERKCPSQILSCFSDLNSEKIGRWNVGRKFDGLRSIVRGKFYSMQGGMMNGHLHTIVPGQMPAPGMLPQQQVGCSCN
jgi:hypothetical protein